MAGLFIIRVLTKLTSRSGQFTTLPYFSIPATATQRCALHPVLKVRVYPRAIGTDWSKKSPTFTRRKMATWSIAFLHFILSLTVSTGVVAATTISGPCEASYHEGRLILSCKGRRLPTVPHLPAGSYGEVTLARNQIARVEGSAFAGISTLCLDLTDNPLIYIAPDAFRGLGQNLTSLFLTFDRSASEFPADIFRQVPNLLSVKIVGHGFRSMSGRDLDGFGRLELLAITQGPLSSVSEDLFRGPSERLETLDLSGNELTVVPLGALVRLRSLKTLGLAKNRISRLEAGSLRGLRVESLDLSAQGSGLSTVDEAAFRDLGPTLKVLNLASLTLAVQHIRASLKPLTRLADLDLSRNRITHLGDAFVAMETLRTLNLQDNPIVALDGEVFRHAASLLVLNLAGNNISAVERGSFSGLTSLEDLDLGYSEGLILDDAIFSAQRKTLKSLKLEHSKFREFRWSAIENLTELHGLFLADCGISDIPDSAFRNMRKLRSVDLKNNRIAALRRESLAGLEGSLEILNLIGNRIRTIDACVFHGFVRLKLFQLSLQMNPLRCDCGLRWLHRWLVNATRNDEFQRNGISWRCSDLNDTLFRDLDASHFEHCYQVSIPLPCPETTTQPLPGESSSSTLPTTNAEPGAVRISLKVVAATPVTLTLTLTLAGQQLGANETLDLNVTCDPISGGKRRLVTLTGNLSTFQVTGLTPSTTYRVCLEIPQSQFAVVGACVTATTFDRDLDLDPALIYGVSAAGAVSLLALLLAVVCCCRCCVTSTTSRRRHSRDHVIGYEEPKLGSNTKRFQKPASVSPPCQDTSELQRTRSIADQLESLTDEERYKLINLLTHSGGSVASLDYRGGRLLQQRLPPGYVTPGPVPSESGMTGKDQYDYIPDDEFYDEISVDDIVV